MTSGNLLIDTLDPRAVMCVGSFTAFFIGLLLFGHVFIARNYRKPLILLTVGMFLAGLSLVFSVLQFSDPTVFNERAAVLIGCTSYLCGMGSLVTLYRPKFSPKVLLVIAAVCMSGFAVYSQGMPSRNWNALCQFCISLLTAAVLMRSNDPLAPGLKWVSVALCLFSALGMAPRVLAGIIDPIDPALVTVVLDTPAYRIRALVWAVMPALIYACVTGVIHARIAQKLKNSADIDILTGAHSRRYLFETGERLLNKDPIDPNHAPTVLLIDVDHFKKFNDTWGHALGDDVLKHCVQCIRAVVRAQDAMIVRYGGEEFCVMLPGIDPVSASVLAERVRQQIANNPYRHGENTMSITVSIGVAQQRGSGTLNALINLADERLYRAKHSGRNRVIDQGGMLVPV